CAQVCRIAFDPLADGRPMIHSKHLLSLKDNCQLDHLEELLLAGASSLKIEGRLKDVDYVKNVTAAYSQALDKVIAKHPERFCRASSGKTHLKFEPNVRKSFNRGFVKDVNQPDANIDTPKSMGEPLTPQMRLHNGDGLCYIDKGKLVGFRVNNVDTFHPVKGVQYYRNQDQEWDKMLAKPSAERKISVSIDVHEDHINMTDEDGVTASLPIHASFDLAHTYQTANIQQQLSRLGNTIFDAKNVSVHLKKNYFIPASILSNWRRTLTEQLMAERIKTYPQEQQTHTPTQLETAIPFEITHNTAEPVMTCKYCIRRQLDMCLKEPATSHHLKIKPLALQLSNGTTFSLEFDCKNCLMKLYLQ
ncbi:MAG: U32 family peptidase, partial [Bacteroidaceae bacterium]|nr:U32 family peptidase [Bacteroidaceae bacterium]